MYVKNEEDYFFVFVLRDEVTVQWSLMGKIESRRFSKDNTNGDWNILIFRIKELMFYGGFKENVEDDNANVVVNEFNTTAFDDLFARGTIYLGGSDKRASHFLNLHYNYTRYNSSTYITNNSVTDSNSVEVPTATLPPEFVANENINVRDKFKVIYFFLKIIVNSKMYNVCLQYRVAWEKFALVICYFHSIQQRKCTRLTTFSMITFR